MTSTDPRLPSSTGRCALVFSSRRRHTRCSRDWSSDVCSSDLSVTGLDVVQNPGEDYPIAKKEHGIDFLLEHRHLWLRSSRPHAMMRIRNTAIMAFRTFFHDEGFLLIDTPILTGSTAQSAGTLFEVPYFD